MKSSVKRIVVLGATSGQTIVLQELPFAGAVEPRRLDDLGRDALHAGEIDQGRKADEVPGIGEDERAERGRGIAEPGLGQGIEAERNRAPG